MRRWLIGLGIGCGVLLCGVLAIMALVVFADEWLKKAQR